MIDNRILPPEFDDPFFDAMGYFAELVARNKLCRQEGFTAVSVSGPFSLEGLLSEMQYSQNMVAVDDTNEGSTRMSDGAYFKTTTYTVWILSKYEFNNMQDRQEHLNLCRTIYTQFLRRILRDKYKFATNFNYLFSDYIETREIGAYFLQGMTGVEFHFNVSVPLELCYNADEWEDE